MADSEDLDKKHPASAKKLQKAREDGNIPRSRDFGHFTALAAGGIGLVVMTPTLIAWMRDGLRRALQFGAPEVRSTGAMLASVSDQVGTFLWVAIPAGLFMAAVGVASGVAIGGWNFTLKALGPKFSVFNPITGIGRLFSKQQLIDAMKASLLALLLGAAGSFYLFLHFDEFRSLMTMPLQQGLMHTGDAMRGGLWVMLAVLAAFAAVDAPLQKWLHAERLKMSDAEVKKEAREADGSPEVKGKRKQIMREMSQRRMIKAVPTADLVVMNPTHYAVALRYDDATMNAPRVVAKGADLFALKIRDTARGAAVPVLEAPVLARALYAHAEVDQEIPAALFAAVAQVLAYVYQLRAAMKGQGAEPGELPELPVPAELDPHHRNTPPTGTPE
jgi:flagellar biosynthetic protein FlhB